MRRAIQTTALPSLLLSCLLAWPVAAVAQVDLSGLPIRGIVVEGATSLPSETLLYYLQLEEGSPFDPEALNANIHTLWERQLIEDIQVQAEPEGDGVRLRLEVQERPILRSITYEGLDKLSRNDISDQMAADRIQLVEGNPLALGEVARLKTSIERLYLERGFRLAQADYRVDEVGSNERSVVFTIDEGTRVRIGEIEFEGNEVFSDHRLRQSMKQTKRSAIIPRLRKRDIYNAANLAEDLQAVRDVYRNAGYKNVHIGEPRVELGPTAGAGDNPEPERRRLVLTVPVEEGERWRMGSIELEGNEKYADEALLGLFAGSTGEWLRANRIDEFVESVTEVYNNTGYIQAQVVSELVERGDYIADVLVQIREGEQYRVGRMEFDGNTKTRDKVLRREMRLQETQVFSTAALRTSLRRVGQLQYWRLDESDPVDLDVDPETKTVDVTVQGQEGDRTELQFGAGWSEVDGFFGQFSIQSRNFLGRGETFGASFQSGRFTDSFSLSYAAPWFLDRPQSIGGQIFQQEQDFSPLVNVESFTRISGAMVSYGRNVGVFGSAGLALTFQDATQRLASLDPEQAPLTFDRTLLSIRPAYSYDNRDNPLFPTHGRRFSAGVEYAGGVLGGDTSFARPEMAFSLWLPVSRQGLTTVWGGHARAGYFRPIGDGGQLFQNDRFLLGGEQTVRGFRNRSIFVRNEDGTIRVDPVFGTIVGGDRMLQFNTEYHLVLGEPFRLLGFFDAGNVWARDQSVDVGNMRMSAGVELRIFVPILGAPLRFIWAQNLDPLDDFEIGDPPARVPGDQFNTFQFSIGTTF